MMEIVSLILISLVALTGCSKPVHYVHATYDFSLIKKVAVLPMENLTQDQQAGEKVRKTVVSELLAAGVVDVIELGHVNRVLTQHNVQILATIGVEDFKRLGAALGAQAFILGWVETYDRVNVGGVGFPEISVTLRAIDAATGSIIWSASQTGGGPGFAGRLLGVGGDTVSEAAQKTVRAALMTLFH